MSSQTSLAWNVDCSVISFSLLSTVVYRHGHSLIKEHPHSVVATEGQWANFSCGIKLPGIIKWRIGNFKIKGIYDYNSGESLPKLEGVRVERSFPPEVAGNILTETIGVLVTADMHGILVKCMYAHPARVTRNCYSRPAIIKVDPEDCWHCLVIL